MIDNSEIVKRLDRRDGYSVVAYQEIGLPVFRLNAALTFQEVSPIGAVEEFVLRALDAGIRSITDLEALLGLPSRLISSQLGQLCYEDFVAGDADDSQRFTLTPAGRRRLQDATTTIYRRQRMPLYVDGITGKLAPLRTEDLWREQDLAELGVACISPGRKGHPRATDIEIGDVNRLLKATTASTAPARRAIQIDAIVGRVALHYRRAIAIAFKSTDGRDVSIAFVIEGRESDEHEIEYARSGAAKASTVFGALFDSDRRRREAQAVQRELKTDIQLDTVLQEGRRPVLRLDRKAPEVIEGSPGIKALSVYDHPPLLVEALTKATVRVLIISPWIRANVVDDLFVRRLSECLDRGVKVTIAFGISKRDAKEMPKDKVAREALEALSRSFPNFSLVKKGNTHAKVLLVDDRFFVTTSFNWLSFNGDPRQPMREEEGVMVNGTAAVNSYYEMHMNRLGQAR